jgi:sporulation protein YqfC
MKVLSKISDYVYEKGVEIHIYKDKVNIVNYIDISDFNNNKVKVKHSDGIVTIIGQKLVVSKLINDEILISGEIKQIELS